MKSIHTTQYAQLRHWLVLKRVEAKLTQAELAEKLGKPQSFVSKYESGERRLDVIEFLGVAAILYADPCEILPELFSTIRQ